MEERTIKISLEKAKEWYKIGGDLREVALQAYTEEELIRGKFGPESWKEYCKAKKDSAAWISYTSEEPVCAVRGINESFYKFNDKSEATAFSALGKLIQLRDAWWDQANYWRPDWTNNNPKYVILTLRNDIDTSDYIALRFTLVFPTKEMRDKFLECFKDLIEQAKMFL